MIAGVNLESISLFAVFASVLAWAAYSDIRLLLIPNRACAALALLWVANWPGTANLPSLLSDIAVAAAVLAAGALLFARNLLGGGDVKFFAAASLWAGADRLVEFLAYSFALGGLLALTILSPLGHWLALYNPKLAGVPARQRRVPLGLAIAIAALPIGLQRLMP